MQPPPLPDQYDYVVRTVNVVVNQFPHIVNNPLKYRFFVGRGFRVKNGLFVPDTKAFYTEYLGEIVVNGRNDKITRNNVPDIQEEQQQQYPRRITNDYLKEYRGGGNAVTKNGFINGNTQLFMVMYVPPNRAVVAKVVWTITPAFQLEFSIDALSRVTYVLDNNLEWTREEILYNYDEILLRMPYGQVDIDEYIQLVPQAAPAPAPLPMLDFNVVLQEGQAMEQVPVQQEGQAMEQLQGPMIHQGPFQQGGQAMEQAPVLQGEVPPLQWAMVPAALPNMQEHVIDYSMLPYENAFA
jgi:hypothetical protein